MTSWLRTQLLRLIDWVLAIARRDSDISLEDYQDLQQQAEGLRATLQDGNKTEPRAG